MDIYKSTTIMFNGKKEEVGITIKVPVPSIPEDILIKDVEDEMQYVFGHIASKLSLYLAASILSGEYFPQEIENLSRALCLVSHEQMVFLEQKKN